jgi:hypothetical protein
MDESLEEKREYINDCFNKYGFFSPIVMDKERYSLLDLVFILRKMKKNKEIEE